MNTNRNLIFLNGEDKTDQIKWIQGDKEIYRVTFNKGSKDYKYKRECVKWIKLKKGK